MRPFVPKVLSTFVFTVTSLSSAPLDSDNAQGLIRFCALILYFVKNKIFSYFCEKYSLFIANNTVFLSILVKVSLKLFFVKIKNKRP